MEVMIHTCRAREWYVNDFLAPSLIEQGIPRENITIWLDKDSIGNLASCIESFTRVSQRPGETWHLQDDVLVCRDFVERTRAAPDGLVCGFCVDVYERNTIVEGPTLAEYMWESSFPCIKIPNDLAGEFVRWIMEEGPKRPELQKLINTGKKDDTLFWIFIQENHSKLNICNMSPHLVEHVDWLIGGSIINQWRGYIVRSCRWDDEELVQELSRKLASY